MKLTVEFYDSQTLIGQYLVDTALETLENLYCGPHPWVKTEMTYTNLKEYLVSRQVDFGRPNRAELLGYVSIAPDVWHEIAKTHGFDADDSQWFRIIELNPNMFDVDAYRPSSPRFKGESVYELYN